MSLSGSEYIVVIIYYRYKMINRVVTILVILTSLSASSQQNFLWDLLDKGKALFRWPSAGSERIMNKASMELLGEYDEKGYPIRSSDNFPKRDQKYEQSEKSETKDVQTSQTILSNSGYAGSQGWGWGWKKGTQQHGQMNHMELYSLLGSLSFLSVIATTLLVLARKNGSLFRSNDEDESAYLREHRDMDNEIKRRLRRSLRKIKLPN